MSIENGQSSAGKKPADKISERKKPQAKTVKPAEANGAKAPPVIQHIPASELADWPVHPLADQFPIVPDRDLQRLAESIAVHQEHPVVVCRRMVIDGRNRIAAGTMLDLTLRVEVRDDLTDDEIERLIIALNIERRSIAKSRLIEIAADFYDSQDPNGGRRSLAQVAQIFGVGKRSLCRYREKLRSPNRPEKLRASFGRIPSRLHIMAVAVSNFWRLKSPEHKSKSAKRFQAAMIDIASEMMSEPEMTQVWQDEFGADIQLDDLRTDDDQAGDDDPDGLLAAG